jgi:hypothetical protein
MHTFFRTKVTHEEEKRTETDTGSEQRADLVRDLIKETGRSLSAFVRAADNLVSITKDENNKQNLTIIATKANKSLDAVRGLHDDVAGFSEGPKSVSVRA